MKQQTIEAGLCTLLLVELPEGIDSFMVHPTKINTLLINSDNNDVIAELPMWSVLIGRLPELTEDEASQLFESDDIFKMYQYYIDTVPYMFITGLEALNELLEANGIVFENPLGKTHPHHPNYTGIAESIDGYLERSDEWKEAQQKVWDRNRTYIFKNELIEKIRET